MSLGKAFSMASLPASIDFLLAAKSALFTPDNAGLSPFMQRLARAHANCVESLPVFGGLLLVAIVSDRNAITDPLAYMFLASRLIQSLVHLVSTSPTAVMVRFAAFAAQIGIGLYWAFQLLS